MSGPLIYVGTHTIREGMVEEARGASADLGRFLEERHPRLLHFQIAIDQERRSMTALHVHPDEASLATHLEVAGDRIAQAYAFLEGTDRIDIFGDPSPGFAERIGDMAMDAPVQFHAMEAGFTRLTTVLA